VSRRPANSSAAPVAPVQPNALDRLVSWVSPAAGLARLEARAALSGGAYAAARTDRTATRNWLPSRGSANADVEGDRGAVTARSRDLNRNNPLAASATSAHVDYMVGTGLWPVPQIDRDLLGLSDAEADAFEEDMDRLWAVWATSRNCDVSRRVTFAQWQALAARSERESGDVFVLRRYKERPGMLFGTCLQMIEADRVDTPPELANRKDVVGGIQFDGDGEPQVYHVRKEHPGEAPGLVTAAPDAFVPVPAYDPATGEWTVLHYVDMLRPEQARGITYLHPVVEALRTVGEFTDAELDAAVIAAFHTVVVKNESAAEELDEEGGIGVRALTVDPEPGAEEDPAGEAGPAEPAMRWGKGNVFELEEGQDVEVVASPRPNPAFQPFWDAMVTHISAASGIPPEVVQAKFVSSYSAARAAFLHLWRKINIRRHGFGESVLTPIRAAVMDEAVARGYLRVRPDYFTNPLVRFAYLDCRWVGDPPGQIDPLKEGKAAELRLGLALTTHAEETLQINGGDFRRNVRQLAREIRQLEESGIRPRPVAEVSAEADEILDREREEAGGED
jgi:lambda family phage portal protein